MIIILGFLIGIVGLVGFVEEIRDYLETGAWDFAGLIVATILVAVGGCLFYFGMRAGRKKERALDMAISMYQNDKGIDVSQISSDVNMSEIKVRKMIEKAQREGLFPEEAMDSFNVDKRKILTQQQKMNVTFFMLCFAGVVYSIIKNEFGHGFALFALWLSYSNYISIRKVIETEENKRQRKKLINKILLGPSTKEKLMSCMLWLIIIISIVKFALRYS